MPKTLNVPLKELLNIFDLTKSGKSSLNVKLFHSAWSQILQLKFITELKNKEFYNATKITTKIGILSFSKDVYQQAAYIQTEETFPISIRASMIQ